MNQDQQSGRLVGRPNLVRKNVGILADIPCSEDFAVDDSHVESVIDRYIREEFDIGDPAWQERAAKEISNRRLGLREWLRRMIVQGCNAREQTDVRNGYEAHWCLAESLEQYVASFNDRTLAVQWRRRGMSVAPQVLRQVHLLYLMRAIETLQPRRVLEVGCGNGNVILTLAARFPQVAFSGIELTSAGVAVARAVQKLPEIPAIFVDSSPEPLRDLTAHGAVDLRVGDARALPYPDRFFDLVYTRLALEQMEQIRKQALNEIGRVAGRGVALIEPWRDYNLTDPGRAYIRRTGYFTGRIRDLGKLGFKVVLSTADIPQKVQFNAGPVIAIRH